ncbi:LOW QUALITY PROTEIN: hypothetical protein MAR_017291 [Mya arenaria]|uniref:Uncharacterized protein n=1 Tax=Mya arenaria TaxID=6604 RepID=A0ABY7EBE9_MYAAR|nr:LOW QUALITY PROTEIN: hypothetical protein MAR_017291 [Mya arenaria]
MRSLDKRFSLTEAEGQGLRPDCSAEPPSRRSSEALQDGQKKQHNKAFRYNLRLKLAVIEGVRNMYYDFAYSKADRVAELRRELFDESVEIVSGSDSEYSSDDLE